MPAGTAQGEPDLDQLVAALARGDRRALARAITLIESTRADHRRMAETLVERIPEPPSDTIRLGISGAPGVGKSTFIEAFGLKLVGLGRRVAVLAVDPSSRRTGGSILGDKTRMAELSRSPGAFIRPSPSAGTLGGVARRTRESVRLCEAAGFDLVMVETVGVGQSETAVADMVDLFCLLVQPAAGDELQGIKRGIVELAELILVTKADGESRPAALRTAAEYRSALRLLRPVSDCWQPPVIPVSALTGEGLDLVWDSVQHHARTLDASGERALRRARQSQAALWDDLSGLLVDELKRHPGAVRAMEAIEKSVQIGALSPSAGARRLLELFQSRAADEPG